MGPNVGGRAASQVGRTPMEEFIARENIRRFQAQLEACDDLKQRRTLQELLDAELQRLADLQGRKLRPAGA